MGWVRGVYPTRQTALDAIQAGDMFVAEENGRPGGHRQDQPGAGPRVRRGRLDPGRPPGTGHGTPHPGGGPPGQGRGYGSRFVAFYEAYALEHGCRYLRMDTNERNASARALYRNLGYREVSIVPCAFNGIPGVQLVCLEKTL